MSFFGMITGCRAGAGARRIQPGVVAKAGVALAKIMVITEISSRFRAKHARGPAVHIRAFDALQICMHLVRYRVRIPWREEDELRNLVRVDELAGAARKCRAHKLLSTGRIRRGTFIARKKLSARGKLLAATVHGHDRNQRGAFVGGCREKSSRL